VDNAWLVVTAGGAFVCLSAVAVVAPRLLRSSSPIAVLVLVVAGAVLGALAPGSPTHLAVLDAVLRGLFGALCVVAAANTSPWPRLVAAVLVAVPPLFAEGGGIPSMLALGVAVASLVIAVDGAVLGAAVGLGVGQAALRLGWPHTVGLSALIALAALLVLLIPALGALPRWARRRLVIPLAILGGLVVLAVGVYAALVVTARNDVNAGIDAANAGLAAARNGDTVEAAKLFDQAHSSFTSAHHRLDAWWGKPVLAVPIAAQQARALDRMSATGVTLAASGASTSRAADPEATKMTDGTVPLDKIAALEAPLTEARTALRRANRDLGNIDATWLVGPLDDKLTSLHTKVANAARDADTGVLAAKVMPSLLGGNGQTKRYFLAFQTPSEQRASGGIIGNFAELAFTNGHLEKVRSGRSNDLNTQGSPFRKISGPADYLARYSVFQPERTWQNVTMSPDWPSTAQVIEELYPQSGGEKVDGAISVDPIALAAFLKLTGPVQVPGLDEPLTAKNAARILLRDQYTKFADRQERIDFLGNAVDAVIDRLQHGSLPSAAKVGEVLGPMVKQGRIKLQSTDLTGEQFFGRIKAAGELPAVQGDFAGLVTQNASGNKIELFLHRGLKYRATVDANGEVHATATITLRNDAPTSGLPGGVIGGSGPDPTPPGHYRGYLSFYTPLAFQHATIDGKPVSLSTATELGRNVLSTMVDVDSGATGTLRIELAGPVKLGPSAGGGSHRYRLTVWHQPTIEPDDLALRISPRNGSSLDNPVGVPHDLTASGDGYELHTRPDTDVRAAVDVTGS
jgi:hypothetical protein